MKDWEIVESIAQIGYVRTYEILANLRKQAEQPATQADAGELNWREVVTNNRREPKPAMREPGEEDEEEGGLLS